MYLNILILSTEQLATNLAKEKVPNPLGFGLLQKVAANVCLNNVTPFSPTNLRLTGTPLQQL